MIKTAALLAMLCAIPMFVAHGGTSDIPVAITSQPPAVVIRTLPDATITPGVVRPEITAADLCPVFHNADGSTGTGTYRNVSEAEKREVYRRYGLTGNHTGYCASKEGCEIDHLVSIEIAGSNDIGNLWPEPYSGTLWTAHVKDIFENYLHKELCLGKITLQQAQTEIKTDWIASYKTHPELPLPH